MRKVTATLAVAGSLAAAAVAVGAANAQVQKTGNFLNLDLAMEAAAESARVCGAQGWPVSVAVVDAAGNVKLQAKGDHSTVHTRDSSFRKAYTVVTLGPVFGFETTSQFVERLKSNPSAPALVSLPNILPLAGAVAVKIHDEIVAAIGVGGAPGGEKDEACAMAGLAKIKDRLAR
ncbi:MAG: heme-binding protein [Xanthobacteraceae bacterium]|nr:heme-binding protein [Xanthobacteraceae bacterium]